MSKCYACGGDGGFFPSCAYCRTDTKATTDDGLRRVTTQQTTGTITARYTPQKPRVPKGEDSTK